LVFRPAPKGTIPHRTIGWIWVTLMTVIALSAFFIHEIRLVGPFSPIHLLAIFTLTTLPLAVRHARGHRVDRHRRALLVAGGEGVDPELGSRRLRLRGPRN